MLMHAIAHGGCTDTVRESTLLTLGDFVYTFVLTAPQFLLQGTEKLRTQKLRSPPVQKHRAGKASYHDPWFGGESREIQPLCSGKFKVLLLLLLFALVCVCVCGCEIRGATVSEPLDCTRCLFVVFLESAVCELYKTARANL